MCGAVRQQIDRDFKCSAALAALYFYAKMFQKYEFRQNRYEFRQNLKMTEIYAIIRENKEYRRGNRYEKRNKRIFAKVCCEDSKGRRKYSMCMDYLSAQSAGSGKKASQTLI